jgi:hypothetical protein
MCAAVTPLGLHIDGMVLNYAQEHLFPVSGIGRLIVEVSRSHTIRHTHARKASFERVIISSQRALPTQWTHKKKVHGRNGIRTRDPSKRTAADLRDGPQGHVKPHGSILLYSVTTRDLLQVDFIHNAAR